jgi:tetratricopeptide (TPR) repeat protein
MRLSSYAGFLGMVALVLVAACDNPKEREAEYVRHGKTLYTSGDFVKASLEFKSALQINPAGAEAQFYLGLIAEKKRDVAAAAAAFRKAAANDPKNVEAQLKAGQFALMGGDAATAKSFADRVVTLSPDNAAGHSLKSASLMLQGAMQEGEKEAKAALALDPNNSDALLLLAGKAAHDKDYKSAEALIERGLKANPKSVDLLLVKLKLMYDQKMTPEVVGVLQELIALDPSNPAYVIDLANQLAISNRLPEAEATFKTALEEHPDSDALVSGYAAFLVSKKSVDEAIAEIKALTKKGQQAAKYKLLLEQLYLRAGKLDEAKALMADLEKNGPNLSDRLLAKVALARIAFLTGDKQGALAKLGDVLKEDPKNEAAVLLRSAISLDDAKFDSAINDARTVLHSDMNSVGALTVLAKAYAANGDTDLSITTYRTLLRIVPNQVDARLELASLLTGKAPDEALDQLDAAIALRPDASELKVQKAEFLIRTGSFDKAEVIANEMLKDPKLAGSAHWILGEVAFARSDFTTAISELQKSNAAGQPFAKVGRVLTEAYVRAGKRNEAEKLLTDRIAANAGDTPALMLMATMRAQESKFGEAEDLLRRVIAAEPRNGEAYINLARLFIGQQRSEDAIKILADAMAELPDNRGVALFAATVQDTAGQLEAAKTSYERLLAKWPDDVIAANNLAALIADAWPSDEAQLARARELAEKFRNTANPVLIDTLAWVLVRKGNFDDAAILLRKSTSLAPDNQQIQYHYAVALKQKGLSALAKQAFAKALAGDPKYRGLDDAKKQAAELK